MFLENSYVEFKVSALTFLETFPLKKLTIKHFLDTDVRKTRMNLKFQKKNFKNNEK